MSDTKYEVGTIISVDKEFRTITLNVGGRDKKKFDVARHQANLLKKAMRAMLDGFAVVVAVGNDQWVNNISKVQSFKYDDEII